MKPLKNWSLLRHLFLGFGISFVILMTTAVAILYFLLVNGLESEKRALMVDRTDAIDALLKSPAHGIEEINRRVKEEWPKRTGERVYLHVVDATGKVLAETPDFPSELQNTGSDEHDFSRLQKIVENPVGATAPVTISAFISKDQSSAFLAHFRKISLLVIAASTLASAAIGWLMARLGMKPIHSITNTIGRIRSDNLHERIVLDGLPVELHGLATAFNQSLNRIEDSFTRLSRFSADIAHELRTPINNMMGEIEVTLGRARAPADYAEVLASNLEECSRLNWMVESMLFLARTENLDYEIHAEPVGVAGELKNILEFFEPDADEKSISLELKTGDEPDLVVMAEPILFQRAIGNLVSNAIRYTPPGGAVILTYTKQEKMIQINVNDSGDGIAEEHLGKIFERFYRVDDSRNINSGGFGLGLAIVKSILQIHGGNVSAYSKVGKGTMIRTEWPIS